MLDCKQYLAVNSRCRNYLVTRKVENCRTQTNSPSSIWSLEQSDEQKPQKPTDYASRPENYLPLT